MQTIEGLNLLELVVSRTDGITVVPWSCGKLLVWDATWEDTFDLSYLRSLEKQKQLLPPQSNAKSPNIVTLHRLINSPRVVFETSGVMGPGTDTF